MLKVGDLMFASHRWSRSEDSLLPVKIEEIDSVNEQARVTFIGRRYGFRKDWFPWADLHPYNEESKNKFYKHIANSNGYSEEMKAILRYETRKDCNPTVSEVCEDFNL